MKRLNVFLIMIICVLFLSGCDFDFKKYCFHIYPNTWEYNEEEHYMYCLLCGEGKTEEHYFDEIEIKEATDTEDGITRFSCLRCDFYYDEPIDKLSHEHSYFSGWESDDLYHWHKANCGHDITSDKMTHSGGTATCIAKARCEVCNTAYGELKEHVYDQKVIDELYVYVSPTCSDEGLYYYSCVCGAIGEEIFNDSNLLEHIFTHYISNGDGTETAYCDFGCGEIYTRNEDASEENHTHTGGLATCTSKAICDICFEEYGELAEHVYDYMVESEAYFVMSGSCQNGDIYYYSCICGKAGEATFDNGVYLSHMFINYVSNNDATCEADGTKTAYCEYGCGTIETIEDVGSKLDHVHTGGIATCTSKAICDICFEEYGELAEHVYDCMVESDTYFVMSGSCQNGDIYYYSCICGKAGEATFDNGVYLPHMFINYVSNNDATCEADGTKTAYCEYGCGTIETTEDVGSKLDHYYDTNYFWLENNTKVSAIATCILGCQNIYTEEVEATYSIIIEPTEEVDGLGRYITLPFNSDIFSVQTKDVPIKAIRVNTSGNSIYGYNDFSNCENGEGMQEFYQQMYTICEDFMSSTEDISLDIDGFYTLDVIDFSIYGLTLEEALAVWKVFYIENPAFYWLSNTLSYAGNSIIFAIDEAYSSASYRAECDEAVLKMVDDSKEYISNANTTLEKAKLIHDFIINRINYAYEADGETPQDDVWAHNIIGTALYDSGVCETYAKTYLYLCLLNGIDCIIVTGYARGSHAWNYISIDNIWYGVDATWDDTTTGVVYNYFGASASTISDHIPDSNDTYDFNYLYALPELSDVDLIA